MHEGIIVVEKLSDDLSHYVHWCLFFSCASSLCTVPEIRLKIHREGKRKKKNERQNVNKTRIELRLSTHTRSSNTHWHTTHSIHTICPWAEFHFASLIIKRKPCYINFASGFEYSRRNVNDGSIIAHHYVRRISAIKSLVSAIIACNKLKYLLNKQVI